MKSIRKASITYNQKNYTPVSDSYMKCGIIMDMIYHVGGKRNLHLKNGKNEWLYRFQRNSFELHGTYQSA
jgi:hypothetical protein